MDLFRQVFRLQVFPLLVIGLTSTQHFQDYFEVSKASYNWEQANKECILAAPNISFSPTIYKVGNLGININEGEEIWVGYFQVVRLFEYIGCVSQKELLEIQPHLDHVEINGDPGHCFPKCQESTLVAVTKSRCYCLGTEWTAEINTKSIKCTDQCKYPRVACGLNANEMYSYLSVYKINPLVDLSTIKNPKAFSSEPNCLCFDPTLKIYNWEYCSLSLLIMCNNGNSIVTVKNSVRESDFSSWTDAANSCFGNSYLPTNYSNSLLVDKDGGSQLWTGCFKTRVTYEYNGKVSDYQSYDKKQYGYLSKLNDGKVLVNFSSQDSLKKVLCVKDEKASIMTTTGRRVLTSTASRSDTTTGSDENGSRVYIPIGTSAAAAVAITASIVTLIVCVKCRRERVTNKCKHNNDETRQDAENENSCPALTALDSTENSYNYIILQPHLKAEETKSRPRDSMNANFYNDTALDRKHEQRRTEHVYNHLDTGIDNTYDHALEQNVNNTVDSSSTCLEDMYDSTIPEETQKAFVHTDNIYNKTDDSADNVYNCLAGNQIKTETDNVYNCLAGNQMKT